MATISLKGNPIHTSGDLPAIGSKIDSFTLVNTDLSEKKLSDFSGKKKVLNIFPSVDTGTCAMSVKKFNQEATELNNTVVLNISMDLPFALKRFCGVEGIKNAEAMSAFRSSFAKDLGVLMTDGPLQGLCSRAVVVLNENNEVIYHQQVSEIADEPDYASAIQHLK